MTSQSGSRNSEFKSRDNLKVIRLGDLSLPLFGGGSPLINAMDLLPEKCKYPLFHRGHLDLWANKNPQSKKLVEDCNGRLHLYREGFQGHNENAFTSAVKLEAVDFSFSFFLLLSFEL